jgi:hypothetical protein
MAERLNSGSLDRSRGGLFAPGRSSMSEGVFELLLTGVVAAVLLWVFWKKSD